MSGIRTNGVELPQKLLPDEALSTAIPPWMLGACPDHKPGIAAWLLTSPVPRPVPLNMKKYTTPRRGGWRKLLQLFCRCVEGATMPPRSSMTPPALHDPLSRLGLRMSRIMQPDQFLLLFQTSRR
ncbi:hypothetical protein CC78DRAFT_584570 [Lojkania enalia]|uniref:Uncharacterized protein n=1 Tax=Lojkania enalia TaxID=147567 RepID=A0A9P4K5U9_9PLEO|nr:hypothetical protein CC78DRAFT_584570 [Didymosphaeria enalia]